MSAKILVYLRDHLSRNSAPTSDTQLYSKKVNVTGVSIWHRVRCYILINLRERSPPHTMFCVHYSRLDSLRVTFRTSILTFTSGVSFSPRKTQGGFPQTLTMALEIHDLGLSYRGTRIPHRTCGCEENSPHNRTCGVRAVNVRCGFFFLRIDVSKIEVSDKKTRV